MILELEDKNLQEVPPDELAAIPEFLKDMSSLVTVDPIPADEIGDRCFSLLGGRVVFGILLAELPDSFLVALASSLVSDGNTVEGKLLTASPVIRLFKNGVAFMSTPEPEHRYYYYRHINQLRDKMPGFFNPTRVEKIEATIALWADKDRSGRLNSSSGSTGRDEVNPDLFSPYVSTTRH